MFSLLLGIHLSIFYSDHGVRVQNKLPRESELFI
jgi:hypothetical protein